MTKPQKVPPGNKMNYFKNVFAFSFAQLIFSSSSSGSFSLIAVVRKQARFTFGVLYRLFQRLEQIVTVSRSVWGFTKLLTQICKFFRNFVP